MAWASTMARGFAGPNFFVRIRQQPSLPLIKLLLQKLTAFDPATTDRRQHLGERFIELVGDDVHVLGSQMERQTFWVLPLLVDEPQCLVEMLWDAGFDASNNCSLHAILEDEDSTVASIRRHIVFLPLHSGMPEREIERLADVVLAAKPAIPMLVNRAENEAGKTAGDAFNQATSGNGEGTSKPESSQAMVTEPHFSKPASMVGQSTR